MMPVEHTSSISIYEALTSEFLYNSMQPRHPKYQKPILGSPSICLVYPLVIIEGSKP
jgi:hypothetical protein